MSLRARVGLVYVACCVLWGSTWLAVSIGLGDLPPRHEPVGWTLVAGGALVLAGAGLANLRAAAPEALPA